MTAVDLQAFPGHSPSAPLDLDSLTTAEFSGIVARLADHSMTAFTEALAAAGNCSHPVRLVGSSSTVDARTGEVVADFRSSDQPLGMLFKPCGNRRADVCPACSRVYARDMYEVISTGLHGGKGVPETVSRNPLLFVTLTGPSFGHVHGPACARRRMPGRCAHGRPLACDRDHDEQDRLLGSPVCWACYDWRTAALWQWHAPELWRRFTITLRRALADALGVPGSRLRNVASVQYAKVAEFQARGIVHFHALIRLDGPGGAGSPAPLPVAGLVDAVEHAARSVRVDALPAGPGDVVRTLRFGSQLDVRVVRTDRALTSTEELTADAVAGYLAKYSTKSSGYDPAAPKPHLDRLARACRAVVADALAGCSYGCGDRARAWRPRSPRPVLCGTCRAHPYALLLKWSASLGFRGHFASKSRRYSVTLGLLREARRKFRRAAAHLATAGSRVDTADLEAALDEEETTLVVGSWSFQGMGWPGPGDKALADAAAARAREYATWRADLRRSHHTHR